MTLANNDIREEVKRAGLKLWQIASKYHGGMTDGNFSRALRFDLSQENQSEIRAIIEELKEDK